MNNLPKEKRDRFILIILLTAGILAGLYFGVIRLQNANVRALKAKREEDQRKLRKMDDDVKNAKEISAQLISASNTLWQIEADMASGSDLYASVIRTIRQFSAGYKVNIPQFGQLTGPADMTLFPRFPYKQVTISISGTAFFHDFGKYLADFENRFPNIRVQNLNLEPGAALLPGENEKLSFRMDVITLVKPSAP